jgi:hypothetical protein
MDLKSISLHFKQSIEEKHTDTLDLSPWEISGFLSLCHRSLHAYICHANEQLGPDSEAYIPSSELEKIESIFRELTDNFFPMAHSNESLRRLQIIDKDEYQRIADGLLRLSRVGEEALDLSDNLSQSIRRLINP